MGVVAKGGPVEFDRGRALALLRHAFGPDAAFRDGQLEAIEALIGRRARLLIVQKTGWGKSIVYFLATRLLRDRGAAPTLIVSPLLSLMRDQIVMARRLAVRVETINRANLDQWDEIEQRLALGHQASRPIDALLISPERLANDRFRSQTLSAMGGVGLFVVDEAHCISDWGHDFRPDYRRIFSIVRQMPSSVPVLATTATANDRVVADIARQLGADLEIVRGELARQSLCLQIIRLGGQAERLAWLAQHLSDLPGSGIVYCLTVADCDTVAGWLRSQGIEAASYYGDVGNERRVALEDALRGNALKVLVATVALGMGFDKPDLGFVVHYQRPGSVVAYYQQVGRAGRAIDRAIVVLLGGTEDDDIQDYFIRTALPEPATLNAVVEALDQSTGLTISQLTRRVNAGFRKIEQALNLLAIEGAVVRNGSTYARSANPWQPDAARGEAIAATRRREQRRMQDFLRHDGCLMEFLTRELDDPTARPCDVCANCLGRPLAAPTVDAALVAQAAAFLRRQDRQLKPRRMLPDGVVADRTTRKIDPAWVNAEGRVLSTWGDGGWGDLVARGKQVDGRFDDALVAASVDLLRNRWRPRPEPAWVTAVPSLGRPLLVPDFARRLAAALDLPYVEGLRKVRDTRPQKEMQNSAQQLENILDAFVAIEANVRFGPVLLVDDMIDSGWTMAVCGMWLRKKGSGPVIPFGLAKTTPAE